MLKIKIKQLCLLIFVGLVTISCDDDNPAASDAHLDAEGFALEVNGTEVYRQLEGTITGDLSVAVNGILEVSVHFLDHDGEEIAHEEGEEEGEEDELSFSISDSSIISVVAEEHEEGSGDEDGEEHHELGFELTGLSVGTTTFTLSLMHEDHADYTSLPISVTVNSEMVSCSGKQLCFKGCCSLPVYAAK